MSSENERTERKNIITVTGQRHIVVPKKWQRYVIMRHIEISPKVHITNMPSIIDDSEPFDPRLVARIVRNSCLSGSIPNFDINRIKILFTVFSPEIMYGSIESSYSIYFALSFSLGFIMLRYPIESLKHRKRYQICLETYFPDLCNIFVFNDNSGELINCYESVFWPLFRKAIHERRERLSQMLAVENPNVITSFWLIYDTLYPVIEKDQ